MKKSKCEICGKRYETYPIFLSNNPISLASFVVHEQKPDGSYRRICEQCREKEERVDR